MSMFIVDDRDTEIIIDCPPNQQAHEPSSSTPISTLPSKLHSPIYIYPTPHAEVVTCFSNITILKTLKAC